jgi:hypothetical protein
VYILVLEKIPNMHMRVDKGNFFGHFRHSLLEPRCKYKEAEKKRVE